MVKNEGKIIIVTEEQTNPFANPEKSRNGGGYDQPLIKFRLEGKEGTFHNTSCGEFGERYSLDWNNKSFDLDEVGSNRNYYSNFNERDKEIIAIFNEFFDIKILLESEID